MLCPFLYLIPIQRKFREENERYETIDWNRENHDIEFVGRGRFESLRTNEIYVYWKWKICFNYYLIYAEKVICLPLELYIWNGRSICIWSLKAKGLNLIYSVSYFHATLNNSTFCAVLNLKFCLVRVCVCVVSIQVFDFIEPAQSRKKWSIFGFRIRYYFILLNEWSTKKKIKRKKRERQMELQGKITMKQHIQLHH